MLITTPLKKLLITNADAQTNITYQQRKITLATLKKEYNDEAVKHNRLIDEMGMSNVTIVNKAMAIVNFINKL